MDSGLANQNELSILLLTINRDTTMINIQNLMDNAKCFETVRNMRWPKGIICPKCDSSRDDLTDTIFAEHHKPLKTWILCLYFMGLNLSNQQIANELDMNKEDVQNMTSQIARALWEKKPEVRLEGEMEFDEVYIIAGHKGRPMEREAKSNKTFDSVYD
ncbi:MAG: hypothetical protein IEMM0008_0993 [bacterium]|nr:MAG: hypothetical protein IEMM0008_0993 [bacterium]